MSLSTRREWMQSTLQSAAIAGGLSQFGWAASPKREPLPVAAAVTEYRQNSHADVLVGKILDGFDQQGGDGPDLKLVSLYTDQTPPKELSRSLAQKHGFRICRSIDEAITLGTDQVQVAGVLSIGEHGNYPKTKDTGQKMYPRRRFLDDIANTFRRTGQVVPVFNDKHLGYRFQDASHMVKTAHEMGFPLMAGSSVPVAWRRPPLVLPMECEIEAALAIGYGEPEAYGFHAIEGLQCMIERRRGGETGVVSAQAVQGDARWQAAKAGRWSEELFEAAMKCTPMELKPDWKDRISKVSPFYLFEHADGLKSCVAMANGVSGHFAFAAKLKGQAEPVATWFELELDRPYGHFTYLLKAIETMFHTGRASYPVERTLLTTGMLDYCMHSIAQDGKPFRTADLNVSYKPVDWPFANSSRTTK
ncbi:hypothetical protein [Thalassoroseus pseudoceratinae]|uniref:hypothetical protein n=1 Tax=Thalassoroseus pseudoceratinae TaxID=2713176 RepID=UPI0014209D58|nr:hypothetical protein [Thalassoroseus pseudoceratinae]